MPVTRGMLEQMDIFGNDSKSADMVVLGYAVLLRWSEAVSILQGLSAVGHVPGARSFMLYLNRSKTDVRGQGTSTRFAWAHFDQALKARVMQALERIDGTAPDSTEVNSFLRRFFGDRARFHGMRHGRASDLLWAGLSKKDLQELGRWATVKAMTLYAHRLLEDGFPLPEERK